MAPVAGTVAVCAHVVASRCLLPAEYPHLAVARRLERVMCDHPRLEWDFAVWEPCQATEADCPLLLVHSISEQASPSAFRFLYVPLCKLYPLVA